MEESQSHSDEPSAPRARHFDLPLYFLLLAASLLGSLAILPYTYTLMKQMEMPVSPAMYPLVLVISVVVDMVLAAAMIALGVALGPPVEMGRLFVPDYLTAETSPMRRFWTWAGAPLVLGIALGVIITFTLANVDIEGTKDNANEMPDALEGLLGSVGAGVREEIWLRFGLLTFFVWLGMKLTRSRTGQPAKSPAPIFWIANLLAALGFAAMHVPQSQALVGLTGGVLAVIFLGNGVPGMVFGWLYWRRGLVAAMIAHFGLDLVLKVFVPLLS